VLVPAGDPSAVAVALRRLADDPGMGRAWGRAGRARVIESFDLERNAARLAACFRDTIAARQLLDLGRRADVSDRDAGTAPSPVATSSGIGPVTRDPS